MSATQPDTRVQNYKIKNGCSVQTGLGTVLKVYVASMIPKADKRVRLFKQVWERSQSGTRTKVGISGYVAKNDTKRAISLRKFIKI